MGHMLMRNKLIRMNIKVKQKLIITISVKVFFFQELTDNEWLVIITPFSDSILPKIYEQNLIKTHVMLGNLVVENERNSRIR